MTATHYSELLDYGLSKPKVSFDRSDRNPAIRIRARAATLGFFVGHLPDFAFHAVFQHAHIAPSQLARITMTRFANSKSVAQRVAKIERENGPRPHSHRAISPVVVWRRNLAAQYKVRSATDAGRAVTGFTIPFVWHAGIGAGLAAFGGGFPAVGALTWAFAIGGGVTRWGFPYAIDNPRLHRAVHSFEGVGTKASEWNKAIRYQGRHRHTPSVGKHRASGETVSPEHSHDHHSREHTEHEAHSCHGHERRHMTMAEAEAEAVTTATLGPCPRFESIAHGPWKAAAHSIKTMVRGKPTQFEVIHEAGARVKIAYALADAVEVISRKPGGSRLLDLSKFDDSIRSCVTTLLDPKFKSDLETSRYQPVLERSIA